MAQQLGRMTARLADASPALTETLLDFINQRIAPGTPVTSEQIYIAAMYLVSDQVNSFGGRFAVDEHQRLAELLIDSPVLVGHRKDHLPIARNFHAELVDREGEKWVKCYFYWLRESTDAESLKANIEGGIYKECSIAFTYNFPECSVCGHDIRSCEHEPNQSYPTALGPAICYFNYRQIERVLETSLVYRGAVPNTLVTRQAANETNPARALALSPGSGHHLNLTLLESLADLDKDTRYLVVPRYDALPVVLTATAGNVAITRLDRGPLPQNLAGELGLSTSPEVSNAVGLLIGYQGKQRCTLGLLEKYLADQSGPVSRVVLAFYPDTGRGVRPAKHDSTRGGLRPLPYRVAAISNISAAIKQMSTRDGVEIWPLSADPLSGEGYLYNSTRPRAVAKGADQCRLRVAPSADLAILSLTVDGLALHFGLTDFKGDNFKRGRQFLADPCQSDFSTGELSGLFDTTFESPTAGLHREGEGLRFSLTAVPDVAFGVRPVIINGRRRFLLKRISEPRNDGRVHAQS